MQRYLNSLASTITGLPLNGASVTVQYYPQGTGSVTTPIASPGVVDWTAHGMVVGQPFVPAGVWPTGVTVGQIYYVLAAGLTANSFEMAAAPGGAAINFTVSAGSVQSINAPIYAVNSTAVLIANPLSSDINGSFGFYAPDGRYQLTITLSGGGSSILADILLDDVIDGTDIALAISGAPAKATPVPADLLGIWDSMTGLLKSIAASFLFSSGDVKSSASANAQTGWLACDGTSYTTAAYPALYASIGYTWGGGGGNFNVPDFRGRTLIGNGTGGGLTARTVGQQTIGEETHLLSTNEMPVHTHAASDSGHAHTIPYNLQGVGAAGGGTPIVGATSNLGTSTSYANISVANAGNGAAHNNMQPSAVIHWLIKT